MRICFIWTGMIHYEATTEKGDKVKKQAILNSEVDELWIEHRYKHIAKVCDDDYQYIRISIVKTQFTK